MNNKLIEQCQEFADSIGTTETDVAEQMLGARNVIITLCDTLEETDRTYQIGVNAGADAIRQLREELKQTESERLTLAQEVTRLAIESVDREKRLVLLECEVQAAVEAQNAQLWISAEDKGKLPPPYCIVPIVQDFYRTSYGAINNNGKWISSHGSHELRGVTHWMPLPEPPKGVCE